MHALLQAMNVPVLEVPGVEADDVIGTLAVRGRGEGMLVDIASPDKDFLQLLRPGLRCLRPAPRGTGPGLVAWDAALLEEKYGIAPEQFVDLLALQGDASDGYAGVRGVGPKFAAQLLNEFGDLETVLERAGEVRRKSIRAALLDERQRESARMSQRLARLQTDLSAPALRDPWDGLRLLPPSDGGDALTSAFLGLEFYSAVERIHALWGGAAAAAEGRESAAHSG